MVGENSAGEEVSYLGRLLSALPGLDGQATPARLRPGQAPKLRFIATLGPTTRPWVHSWADADDAGGPPQDPARDRPEQPGLNERR